MHAIVVEETGTPDVLRWSDVPEPIAGANELIVRVAYAGVNYIDTYQRTGLYPVVTPFTPGVEGCGEVVAVGEGVEDFSPGQRVAWTDVIGSYAEVAAIPAGRAVAVPDELASDVATAAMLQALTAHYLINDTYPLISGDRCLIHAGAGGVGRLLIQMAKTIGAEVFATVGSEKKARVAQAVGADHVINYEEHDFLKAIEAIAGPRPLDVVYDGVGAATFDQGLDLLRPTGLMVTFGNASGPVPPLELFRLSGGGSLYVTRPTLGTYIADTAALRRRCRLVFAAISSGDLDITVGVRFPLSEAADAHRALEGRATTAKVLLEA